MLTIAATETIGAVADTTNVITMTMFGMELTAGVESYKVLYQGRITNSVATKYTAPSSTEAFVKSIHLANTSAADVSNVILYLNGTGAGQKICTIGIPANGMAIMGEDGWRVYTASGELVKRISNLNNSDGFRYQFTTGTTIADPTTGGFSFNNATITSATHLCISETSMDSAALALLMDAMLNGKTAILQFQDILRSSLITVQVTACVDNGTWRDLTCTVTQNTLAPVVLTDYYLVFMAAWPAQPLGIAGTGRLSYKRSTTTTAADPGAGFYRLSNLALYGTADVFSLHVSDFDNNGVNQKSFWNSLIASDNRVNTSISIGTGSTDTGPALARITAVTVNSGYTTLTCVFIYGGINAGPANNAVCDLHVWTEIDKMSLPVPPLGQLYAAGLPGFIITHQDTVAMPTATAQCHLFPFFTQYPIMVRGFIWNINAISASNTSVVLGVFRGGGNTSGQTRLGAKMFEIAAVTGFFSATGAARVNAGNVVLPPGLYWVAFAHKALSGSPVMRSPLGHYLNNANLYADGTFSQNTGMDIVSKTAISGDFTSGGLPAEGTSIALVTFTRLGAAGTIAQTPAHVILEYWPLA